jgi:1-deoxy-D-xylulose-5-phosphate reductoisomerase
MRKKIAVLGATGSIGKSTLDVLRQNKDDFECVLLTAKRDEESLGKLKTEFPNALTVLSGKEGKGALLNAIADCGADIGVNGIAGAPGLEPSLACIDAGMNLALANKETIVMAGPLAFKKADENHTKIIPVDSEHSAVFNLIEALGSFNTTEIILTASGGPFRNYSMDQLEKVTPKEALAHPTWNMGTKITLDSATLANKGLEVIEAACLFGFPLEKIKVVIHPQSIVHSLVRIKDGAVYAQLSRPDMRLPIHEALYWPQIIPSPFGVLDFENLNLSFEKPDAGRFPMLALAYEALKAGPLMPVVYNAANEIAADAFLKNKIGFLEIPGIVGYVLKNCRESGGDGEAPSLKMILDTDGIARKTALKYIGRTGDGF